MGRKHDRARAVLVALTLAWLPAAGGCGGSDDEPFEPAAVTEVSVSQLLRDSNNFDARPVLLRGSAYPIGGLGFALEQGGRAIFVQDAKPERVSDLSAGEEVEVRGVVAEIGGDLAEDLRKALDEAPDGSPPIDPGNVTAGLPYVKLRAIDVREP